MKYICERGFYGFLEIILEIKDESFRLKIVG
jgi:hypothetical protein